MSSDLTTAEMAHAQEMKRQWLDAFGDDEFIREAYKVGLIRGWRDVVRVEKLNQENEHEQNR